MKKLKTNNKIFLKVITLIKILLLQVFIVIFSFVFSIHIPIKSDTKKVELLLENKYSLILQENGMAKLTGGVGGLYGEKGESEGENIYKNEKQYKDIMENIFVSRIVSMNKDSFFVKNSNFMNFVGYIEKDEINSNDSEDIKRVKEIKNKLKAGYFYSDDNKNIIKFSVSEEEIKHKYGENIIEKMQKLEKIIEKYGSDTTPVNIKQSIYYKRMVMFFIIANIFILILFLVYKKYLIFLLILISFYSYSEIKNDTEKKKICSSYLEKYPRAFEIFKTALNPNIFDGGWTWYPCVWRHGEKCIINGFAVNKDELNSVSIRDIRFLVEGINFLNISGKIELIGYSDNSMRTEKENKKISLKRAKNVEKILRENGLKSEIEIVKIVGMGSKNPMYTNDTVAGKYNNRRVELILKENETCDTRDYFDF